MQNQINDSKIVIVGENEAYTGDQVALRFVGAEMKETKIASFASIQPFVGLEMAWSVSLCVVHIPDRYRGISFDRIFQQGASSRGISPNILTEGDTITMGFTTNGQISVKLIEKSQKPGSFFGELLAGIGTV